MLIKLSHPPTHFCYSSLLFLLFSPKPLPYSAERHKNNSHKHFPDSHQKKYYHCHCLFLLFCFHKTISYCQSIFLLLPFYNSAKNCLQNPMPHPYLPPAPSPAYFLHPHFLFSLLSVPYPANCFLQLTPSKTV